MLDTSMDAKPGSLLAVMDYLARSGDYLQEWEASSRNASDASQEWWTGVAAAGFTGKVLEGADAAAELVTEVEDATGHLSTVVDALYECLGAMQEARDTASAAGLILSSQFIYPPSRLVWQVDRDPNSTIAERQRVSAQKAAWDSARGLEYRARRTWENAVSRYLREAISDNISGLISGTSVAGAGVVQTVKARADYYATGINRIDDMTTSITRNIEALDVDGRVVGSRQHYYEETDRAGFTAGGAAIGSFFAPPVGTVVGGVIGGAIGIFAGGFGQGVTDYLFEDLSPDIGGAISAGWEETKGGRTGYWRAILRGLGCDLLGALFMTNVRSRGLAQAVAPLKPSDRVV